MEECNIDLHVDKVATEKKLSSQLANRTGLVAKELKFYAADMKFRKRDSAVCVVALIKSSCAQDELSIDDKELSRFCK